MAVDVEQGEWDADETPRSVITLSCRDRPNLLDTITRIISRLSRYPPSQSLQPQSQLSAGAHCRGSFLSPSSQHCDCGRDLA